MTNNHNSELFDLLGNIIVASVCNKKMYVTIYNGSPGARAYMRTRAGVSLIACCAMHVPRIMKSGAMHGRQQNYEYLCTII